MLYGPAAAGEVERQQGLWEAKLREAALLAETQRKAVRASGPPRFLGTAPVASITAEAILGKLQSESNLVQLKPRVKTPTPARTRQGVFTQVQ